MPIRNETRTARAQSAHEPPRATRCLAAPGPVFVALKVWPDIENTPIGQRVRWRKRAADKVVQDLRGALGA